MEITSFIGTLTMELTIKHVVNGYVVERKVNQDVKLFAFGGDNACADMLRFILSELEPESDKIRIEDADEYWSEGV